MKKCSHLLKIAYPPVEHFYSHQSSMSQQLIKVIKQTDYATP